ncbi:hypothetical protein CANCADRAFT_42259 [Tortispora caseinolytica NRRL Y-17796]|uniref:Endosomal/vacuolar adapter protein YPT35 n=1 Tax=Tortispora caseinolytica NRRL Y-17796 TaxID=767744 RepID=A0A1E4TIR8_9ASCO|nr:hypothetical protein CANCADRAFT_42259 [Tortispora caseinolytica NRRL Y-17796]
MSRRKSRSSSATLNSAIPRSILQQNILHAVAPEPIESAHQITLEDAVSSGTSKPGVWAMRVWVGDYTIVKTQLGSEYVAWNILVETLDGATIRKIKRYSEFCDLRSSLLEELEQSEPRSIPTLPQLPPKAMISRFRPDFLEKRREGLEYFLTCVLLNPVFANTDSVRRWLA